MVVQSTLLITNYLLIDFVNTLTIEQSEHEQSTEELIPITKGQLLVPDIGKDLTQIKESQAIVMSQQKTYTLPSCSCNTGRRYCRKCFKAVSNWLVHLTL